MQAYSNLQLTLQLFLQVPVVPFDQTCEYRYQQLLAQKLRIGAPDLKIAATALACGLIVVTRNKRDFQQVPGLVIEDWSGP